MVVQDDGVIKVEVAEEHLGGTFSDEELQRITDILSDEIEKFLIEQGSQNGLEKLQKMKLPSAQEILTPGFSLSRKYNENFY